MSHYKAILTAGLAMFAMFFGSGNLVFPLIIGVKTVDQYAVASLGLMVTGVLVPFLGLFSMVLFQGNKDVYFGLLGKYAPFTLSLLILSLIGPFGVVPRCILVAYGGISLVYPEIPLYLFSAVFVILIFFIIWRESNIVPIIGKYLGPLKIAGIIIIIIAAIMQSPQLMTNDRLTDPFMLGITEGYQTMDLMASFFFSITVVEYLRRVCSSKVETLKVSLLACGVGAFLISSIYIGFIYLGAHYASDLINISPEKYLATIAQITLGEHAALILALTIFLSCLVTAACLVRIFAEFLRKDVTQEKFSWNLSISITLGISFILSLTGFSAIVSVLGSILVYVYPALIGLTIASILYHFYGFKWTKQVFWLTLVISSIYKHI